MNAVDRLKRFTIRVHSNGCRVSYITETERAMLYRYSMQLASYEIRRVRGGRLKRELKYVFCVLYHPIMEYGFVRGHLDGLLEYLRGQGVRREDIEIEYTEAPIWATVDIELIDSFALRSHQVPIIDFISKGMSITTLAVQTAMGKTAISLYYIAKCKVRTAIVMGARDIPTWKKEISNIIKSKDIYYIISGKKALVNLIDEAKEGKLNKAILLFSVNTLRDYFTEYEKTGSSTYGCNPIDLFKVLKVGLRINDEAHEKIHFIYRLNINTNVAKVIYLSGSIKSHDKFTNTLYNTLFPPDSIYRGLKWNKYINATAIGYKFSNPSIRVRTDGPTGSYDHKTYEAWIEKNPTVLEGYLKLIKDILVKFYLNPYIKGQKALIMMATISLTKIVSQSIKNDTRFNSLVVADYSGEHESSVLHSQDIVVSTVGSTSTGVDIKHLVFVLNTVNIKSLQANIQISGRLRVIEDLYPGVVPEFAYMTNIDIPKHVEYHKLRTDIYKPLVKNFNSIIAPHSI